MLAQWQNICQAHMRIWVKLSTPHKKTKLTSQGSLNCIPVNGLQLSRWLRGLGSAKACDQHRNGFRWRRQQYNSIKSYKETVFFFLVAVPSKLTSVLQAFEMVAEYMWNSPYTNRKLRQRLCRPCPNNCYYFVRCYPKLKQLPHAGAKWLAGLYKKENKKWCHHSQYLCISYVLPK